MGQVDQPVVKAGARRRSGTPPQVICPAAGADSPASRRNRLVLPLAVAAAQPDDLAALQREIQPSEQQAVAAAAGQVAGRERGAGGGHVRNGVSVGNPNAYRKRLGLPLSWSTRGRLERFMHVAPRTITRAEDPPCWTAPRPVSRTSSPATPPWRSDGLRDFFLYKDLGVEAATAGRVLAQLVKANMAPEKGTGWHRHEADFHIVIMTKGWAQLHVRRQGNAGRRRRLRAPAPRHRALPVRLLAGHGVPRRSSARRTSRPSTCRARPARCRPPYARLRAAFRTPCRVPRSPRARASRRRSTPSSRASP